MNFKTYQSLSLKQRQEYEWIKNKSKNLNFVSINSLCNFVMACVFLIVLFLMVGHMKPDLDYVPMLKMTGYILNIGAVYFIVMWALQMICAVYYVVMLHKWKKTIKNAK